MKFEEQLLNITCCYLMIVTILNLLLTMQRRSLQNKFLFMKIFIYEVHNLNIDQYCILYVTSLVCHPTWRYVAESENVKM